MITVLFASEAPEAPGIKPEDRWQPPGQAVSSRQLEAFREFAGDGVIRLSVGLEDADDLCRDLDAVLSA